jgi:hypothetical protein
LSNGLKRMLKREDSLSAMRDSMRPSSLLNERC